MKNLLDMDTIQIECTTRCINKCSNCTRFIKHYPSWDMDFNQFKEAVDSMVAYPKMTGMTGGDPILHPDFEKMCNYLHSKILPERCGLWTCFPPGKEHYREVIVETFGHVFLNDHSRSDIMHHPFLVGVQEVFPEKYNMNYNISHCIFQESWSASINPRGAFFCEMAASQAMLFNELHRGWDVKPYWWTRQVWDFKEQVEHFCPRCGGCVNLKKRASVEEVDDISPKNWELLGKPPGFVIHDLKTFKDTRPLASYKDERYRALIAKKYGIFLVQNKQNFMTPYLYKDFEVENGNNILL